MFRTKVYAFAVCALLGGLAGGLFAGGFAYVSPDQFSFAESIVFLTMSLLGGVASPIGSAIGTGLLILIPEWLRFLKSIPGLYLAIYGLFVILIIRFMPDGIWGFVSAAFERWRERTRAPPAAKAKRDVPEFRCEIGFVEGAKQTLADIRRRGQWRSTEGDELYEKMIKTAQATGVEPITL